MNRKEHGCDPIDAGASQRETDTTDPGFWDDVPVVHSYTWHQAVDDGQLVKCLENRWPTLSGGRPILATVGVVNAFSTAALVEIWNSYVEWRRTFQPALPEEVTFTTTMNNERVRVIDDGATFTILFPHEY